LHEITELKAAADKIASQNDLLVQTNRDLVEAQKQAEESSRLKSEFLATMSHELRTPLNAIIGFTDFMLNGLPANLTDKQRDYLQRVVANGERLLALINDVLDIAKIEAARLELSDVAITPGNLLKAIDSQLHTLADQKGLTFETHLDPTLPTLIKGDPKRLEQIMVNLIGNAIRFTETGGVSVRFDRIELARWTITVTDTGVGIPPHALDFIFDEFRQVDGSARREYGGTGLGLAIVRKLAVLMGGTVRVQSEVGKGSTFIVQLPLRIAETAASDIAEDQALKITVKQNNE
jgi:signal transduction histidine kinase